MKIFALIAILSVASSAWAKPLLKCKQHSSVQIELEQSESIISGRLIDAYNGAALACRPDPMNVTDKIALDCIGYWEMSFGPGLNDVPLTAVKIKVKTLASGKVVATYVTNWDLRQTDSHVRHTVACLVD